MKPSDHPPKGTSAEHVLTHKNSRTIPHGLWPPPKFVHRPPDMKVLCLGGCLKENKLRCTLLQNNIILWHFHTGKWCTNKCHQICSIVDHGLITMHGDKEMQNGSKAITRPIPEMLAIFLGPALGLYSSEPRCLGSLPLIPIRLLPAPCVIHPQGLGTNAYTTQLFWSQPVRKTLQIF